MTSAQQLQLAIEPAFFWFIVAGGSGLFLLGIIRLIEFFSKEKMLFRRSEKARKAEKARDEMLS